MPCAPSGNTLSKCFCHSLRLSPGLWLVQSQLRLISWGLLGVHHNIQILKGLRDTHQCCGNTVTISHTCRESCPQGLPPTSPARLPPTNLNAVSSLCSFAVCLFLFSALHDNDLNTWLFLHSSLGSSGRDYAFFICILLRMLHLSAQL